MITTPTQAQLKDIREQLVLATDTEDVVRASLQLVAWLEDAWKPTETEALRQLVREIYDALSKPDSRVDVRDWLRAAAPFIGS